MRIAGSLLSGVIYHLPKVGVIFLVSARDSCTVCLGRICFEQMPAEAGRLNGAGPGEHWDKACSASKVYREG